MDVGGGSASDVEDEIDDAPIGEFLGFPVYDHRRATDLALQQDNLKRLQSKTRLSASDKQLIALDKAYGGMLKQKNSKNDFQNLALGLTFGGKYKDMLALQRNCIALAKNNPLLRLNVKGMPTMMGCQAVLCSLPMAGQVPNWPRCPWRCKAQPQ